MDRPPPLPPRRPLAATVPPPEPQASPQQSFENTTESTPADLLVETKPEEELSEIQLRELYDDEEIDRFLNLFSAFVKEVRLPGGTPPHANPVNASSDEQVKSSEGEIYDTEAEEGDWVPLHSPVLPQPPPLPPRPKSQLRQRGLAERIASDYVVPLLPPAPAPPPDFSLRRFKLTAQRTYLAIEPAYLPFINHLIQFATWQEPRTSFIYCALYWILWLYNLLLPALVLHILYMLVRRKIFPYPTLAELRERRHQVDRAADFGTQLSIRMAASPAFGIKDVWGSLQDFNRIRKMKKNKAKTDSIVDDTTQAMDALADQLSTTQAEEDNADLQRTMLFIMSQVADLHERVKNIFLWRKPVSSMFFGMILVVILFITLLPAKYIFKIVGFCLGFIFWHVVPIIAAIPPADRARFPPLFNDVPTDSEYAMELISQRVARGLDIKPRLRKHHSWETDADLDNVDTLKSNALLTGIKAPVDWKKWGGRVANTKAWTGEVKSMFKDGQWKDPGNWPQANPLVPKVAGPGGSEPRVDTHSYPAQYSKSPGLITLTPTTFYFTSLLSSRAKLTIELKDIIGVKKTGLTRGLLIRWNETVPDGCVKKEDKFMWVAERDELFGRLVGWEGRRWLTQT